MLHQAERSVAQRICALATKVSCKRGFVLARDTSLLLDCAMMRKGP